MYFTERFAQMDERFSVQRKKDKKSIGAEKLRYMYIIYAMLGVRSGPMVKG